MKIKEIKYFDPLTDLENDCLDVFVILEDDSSTDEFSYFVEVATPQYLSALMEKFESDFLPPGYPYIIVSKLTDDIIKAALQSFIDTEDDSYWLKLYHVTATLEIEDLNEILDRKEQENIDLEAKIDAEVEAESDINH
jgi:hypothetical protein